MKISKNKKIILIILSVLILWSALFFGMWAKRSKRMDDSIIPQIKEFEILENKIGKIKKATRNMFHWGYILNDEYYIKYKIITKNNKKYLIKFIFDAEDQRYIVGFELNGEKFYDDKN